MKNDKKQPQGRPVPVKLSDNQNLILLQSAEINANTKSASIYQTELFSALNELYKHRIGEINV